MAYDFNYDLFALTPDKFRSRWAPSLKDFNDEEILRMRAAATPPRRILMSGVMNASETALNFDAVANSVVVAMRFFTDNFNLAADSRYVALKRTPEDAESVLVPIYGFDNITIEDFFANVEATLTSDEQIIVHVLGYTPE